MKQSLIIVTCLICMLSSCNSNKHQTNNQKVVADTLPNTIDSIKVAYPAPPGADTILQSASAIIKGIRYTAILKTNDSLYVCKKKDTILKVPDVLGTISFEDFDRDGYKDIIMTLFTNTPGIQELFLFDKHAQTFKPVDDFTYFPASEPIPGTKYYYSYHRSGCSDMNWDSDLFYIKNHKAIRIGNIAGRGCKKRDPEYGIYIHRVKEDKETLVKTLPISTLYRYKELKWGFIADYWKKNYKAFL